MCCTVLGSVHILRKVLWCRLWTLKPLMCNFDQCIMKTCWFLSPGISFIHWKLWNVAEHFGLQQTKWSSCPKSTLCFFSGPKVSSSTSPLPAACTPSLCLHSTLPQRYVRHLSLTNKQTNNLSGNWIVAIGPFCPVLEFVVMEQHFTDWSVKIDCLSSFSVRRPSWISSLAAFRRSTGVRASSFRWVWGLSDGINPPPPPCTGSFALGRVLSAVRTLKMSELFLSRKDAQKRELWNNVVSLL